MIEERRLAWGFVSGGLAGLVASAVLLIERIRLAENGDYVPTCSINPIISCGSIMESAQASLLGFPNPLIGVATFPVLVTTGAVMLAGGRVARWYWLGLQAGVTAGFGLIAWLVFQSLYRIGALCPYCMVVWAAVIPLFWYVTLRNLAQGIFGQVAAGSRATAVVSEWHAPVLLAAYLAVVTVIAIRFWSYWSTLL